MTPAAARKWTEGVVLILDPEGKSGGGVQTYGYCCRITPRRCRPGILPPTVPHPSQYAADKPPAGIRRASGHPTNLGRHNPGGGIMRARFDSVTKPQIHRNSTRSRRIGRDILAHQNSAGWGTKVIDRLAGDLTSSYPSRTFHRSCGVGCRKAGCRNTWSQGRRAKRCS